MSAIGVLLFEHLKGTGQTIRDPENDTPAIDLEALWARILVRKKLEGTEFASAWAKVQGMSAEELGVDTHHMTEDEARVAVNLARRMEQFGAVIDHAVDAAILDSAQIPHDAFDLEDEP